MRAMPIHRGDVVISRFPFTDLSGTIPRPSLIISTHPTASDFIVAFISKVIPPRPGPFDYVVRPDHPEFSWTGLRFPSVFRMNKIVTLNRVLITSRLGRVGARISREVDIRLRAALGLQT